MRNTATERLMEEHDVILQRIDDLERVTRSLKEGAWVDPAELDAILAFFETFGADHHHKEEEILFPVLFEKNAPLGGGPLCVYFKELAMMEEPFEQKVKELDQVLSRFDIRPEKRSPEKDPRTAGCGSPLNPIFQEHILGERYLKAMRVGLKLLDESPVESLFFISYSRRYTQMLRGHIDKENRCLFVMADSVLNADQQEELKKAFDNFDLSRRSKGE